MKQRRKSDDTILQVEPYGVGQHVGVLQKVIPPKETKKATEEIESTVHGNGIAPAG